MKDFPEICLGAVMVNRVIPEPIGIAGSLILNPSDGLSHQGGSYTVETAQPKRLHAKGGGSAERNVQTGGFVSASATCWSYRDRHAEERPRRNTMHRNYTRGEKYFQSP